MSYINRDKLIQFLSAWKQSEGDTELSAGFIADHILEKISWKPMDTAPKDRPILVWAYSSAEWWKTSPKRMCLPVEFDSGEWFVVSGTLDNTGNPFSALDPIAWMEVPNGPG